MSLKTFHIFFIAISALLLLGLSAVAFRSFIEDRNGLLMAAGLLAMAAAVTLVIYGVNFLKKLRHVSFM